MFKIGFCCKYLDPLNNKEKLETLNTKTTTNKWLTENVDTSETKLFNIVSHNLKSTMQLLQYVNSLPTELKAIRLSSDLLPMFTHQSWSHFYQQDYVKNKIETEFSKIGEYARLNGIRVSMHPGQFCVLASENPNIVNNSIAEFEYHAYMLSSMGYCKTFQDAKCNIHISGKQGVDGMIAAYKRLSPEARNVITIENEEITHGLDECIALSSTIPVVLDLHHHFIATGEYINVKDDRVKRVQDSWRGMRPAMHFSQSREDVLVNHCPNTMPDLSLLLSAGYKKQKLRAHSDFLWNTAVNNWALQFLDIADIMVEAKAKNLASINFYNNHAKLLLD